MNSVYKSSCCNPQCRIHNPQPRLMDYNRMCDAMRNNEQIKVTAYSAMALEYKGLIRGIQMEDGSGKSYNVTMLLDSGEMKTLHVRVV